MASFWDKLKALIGVGPPEEAPPPAPPPPPRPRPPQRALERAVEASVVRRMTQKASFQAIDVADEVATDRTAKGMAEASAVVARLHAEGRFEPHGYARTKRADGNWVYHPKGQGPQAAPNAPPAARAPQAKAAAAPAKTTAAPARASAPAQQPAVPRRDPYAAEGILGLSADELRKRALRINPYRTAWIGRVDTIPPQSDERTALIDRGLILRGMLTTEQITEIHRIGDLWLRHHEAAKLAASAAGAAADRGMEQLAQERAEKKARKQREAAARAEKRAEEVLRNRREDIVYLGVGVSSRLADRRSHVEELSRRGLPLLSTPADVARALGIPVPELRFLCFHAEATEKPHYVYFEVPKRSGGMRRLAAPQPRLASAQAWVLREVLEKLPTEAPAHGFIKGRSTVTCARPHVGKDAVINVDLADFFPTITFGRVRGLFEKLGYSPAVSTVFALLTTESPRAAATFEGKRWWAAVGPRALPQGACTSPAISNQVVRKLDRRLVGMSLKHGFTYSRYADDLTFSGDDKSESQLGMLLARVRHVVEEEGFALNPTKGRVQRSGGRQTVTGIVVNDRPGVPREEVRRLRSILHHAEHTGLAAQNREDIPHFEAHLRGRLAYLHMVDPARAAPMIARFDALVERA